MKIKLPKLMLASLLICSVMLSGCTALLWDWALHQDSETKSKIVGEDTLRSMGKTKSDDRLVVIGDKYWYLVDKENSKKLLDVFTSKLSQPFYVSSDPSDKTKKAFNIIVSGKEFNSWVCLYYKIKTNNPETAKAEAVRLSALNFELNREKEDQFYLRCFDVKGERYTKPKEHSLTNEFKFNIPVGIMKQTNIPKLDNVADAVILTPLTLVGDVVVVPLMLLEMSTN